MRPSASGTAVTACGSVNACAMPMNVKVPLGFDAASASAASMSPKCWSTRFWTFVPSTVHAWIGSATGWSPFSMSKYSGSFS